MSILKKIILVALVGLPLFSFSAISDSQAQVKFEIPLPPIGRYEPGTTPASYIRYLFVFGLAIGGILAFAMIVVAGIQYALAGANPGWQNEAKDKIFQAILGLLLLLFSFIILQTINPSLVSLKNPPLAPIPIPPPPPGQTHTECINKACKLVQGPGVNQCQFDVDCQIGGYRCATVIGNITSCTNTPCDPANPVSCTIGYQCVPIGQCSAPTPTPTPVSCDSITPDMCSNSQALAQACNAAIPAREAPATRQLDLCVRAGFTQRFGRSFGGSVSTYEVSNPLCNYTKGREVCGQCAHAVNSCHYGGSPSNPNGNQGALAIDYGLGWLSTGAERERAANAIIQAGSACGMRNARCENGSATVPCNQANHVHMNVIGCNTN